MANRYQPTKTKREAANLLRTAARLIEKYGFRRGTGGGTVCGFCILGALAAARGRDGHHWTEIDSSDTAFCALQKTTDSPTVYGWNDLECKSKHEAARKLRQTARALEHGLQVG